MSPKTNSPVPTTASVQPASVLPASVAPPPSSTSPAGDTNTMNTQSTSSTVLLPSGPYTHIRSTSFPSTPPTDLSHLPKPHHYRAKSEDDLPVTCQNENENHNKDDIGYLTEGGNLEFRGFSWRDQDGAPSFHNASAADHQAVVDYLQRQYGVTTMNEYPPFLILGCKHNPSANARPFIIGGFIAIWRADDNMLFDPFPGEHGADMETEGEVEESLLEGFAWDTLPDPKALAKLAAFLFPECVGVAWITNFVIFEFPPCDSKEEWGARLDKLPFSFSDVPFRVLYSNGPLASDHFAKRAKNPTPKMEPGNRIDDDTDYVARDGVFYPGSMISSAWKGDIEFSATAGILLERNGQQRLTCSWHLWDKLATKHAAKLGSDDPLSKEVFTVYQGDTMTPVGTIVERIGQTDIALAKLHDGIKFRNESLGSGFIPRCLAPSSDVKYLDQFMIDSFTTGKQNLVQVGVKVEAAREPGSEHPDIVAPANNDDRLPVPGVEYIHVSQGIHPTEQPEMTDKPYIRDSACGSVLIRSHRYVEDHTGPRKKWVEGPKATLPRGEVFGMMHLADITNRRAYVTRYVIYADSFTPLIQMGWTVVPLPGSPATPNVPVPDPLGDRGESPRKRLRGAFSSN